MLRSAFAAAALGLVISAPAQAQEKSINVMMWGSTWQTALQQSSADFTKKTGIKVNLVTQASSGEGLVKLQTMKAKPTIDVWFTTASVAERAVTDDALFAPLPAARMSNLGELAKGTATDRYVGIYGYPVSIIYRTDLVQQPIKTWSDLWQPRFAGKLAVPAMGVYQGRALMIAAMSGGGSATDADKGFEMLGKLKPNVVMFYGTDTQARQALAQGEVSVLVGPPSQAKRMADAGRPVAVVSPKPAIMNFDVATIVRSGKEDLAAQYINFLLEREANQALAGNLNMSPVNKNAKPSDYLAPMLPKPEDAFIPSEEFVNQHIAAWTERFNRDIVK
ncbi:PotD/PotF family extracellular solute-binding protein [Herbaspirillum sp. YR522]|uniref:ABC transporter substrate-binding protein n=1 Tax=Herbaspirillum sp. YR522 TaxID=1144342 RepID=UPI00058F1378|nr:extracellular solute-binding protein [Herbaspirillum sp. YR522]